MTAENEKFIAKYRYSRLRRPKGEEITNITKSLVRFFFKKHEKKAFTMRQKHLVISWLSVLSFFIDTRI
jgi:hypothetical protein